MSDCPNAYLVYGFAIDEGTNDEVIEQVARLLDWQPNNLTDEQAEMLDEDPYDTLDKLAHDAELELMLGYSSVDSNYIIYAPHTLYSASENTTVLPWPLPSADTESVAKLETLAAKLRKEPSWLLVAYYG